MTLARARNAPELLDEPRHDEHELTRSLAHLAAINRWLGGTHALLRHVGPLLRADRTTRILDVGTGSADLPRNIVDWARRHDRRVAILATDVHPQMRAVAAAACAAYPEITVQLASALALPFATGSFDISTVSLTLHHFDEADQLRLMRELARVTRHEIIVNELQRTRLHYLCARLMAHTLWRGNRLTRHDAPLSVLRAFNPAELLQLAGAAGLSGRTYHHFFQRVVLLATRDRSAASRTELK